MKLFISFFLVIFSNPSFADGKSDFKMLQNAKVKFENPLGKSEKFLALSEMMRIYASISTTNFKEGEDARESAKLLLQMSENFKDHWNYGNAIHHSRLVLGRVDLAKGNLKSALKRLAQACEVSGSPQLNTFGPNMTLAKEILEKDMNLKNNVYEYFDKCTEFWIGGVPGESKKRINKWKAMIAGGKVPDFKSNLKH